MRARRVGPDRALTTLGRSDNECGIGREAEPRTPTASGDVRIRAGARLRIACAHPLIVAFDEFSESPEGYFEAIESERTNGRRESRVVASIERAARYRQGRTTALVSGWSASLGKPSAARPVRTHACDACRRCRCTWGW